MDASKLAERIAKKLMRDHRGESGEHIEIRGRCENSGRGQFVVSVRTKSDVISIIAAELWREVLNDDVEMSTQFAEAQYHLQKLLELSGNIEANAMFFDAASKASHFVRRLQGK